MVYSGTNTGVFRCIFCLLQDLSNNVKIKRDKFKEQERFYTACQIYINMNTHK